MAGGFPLLQRHPLGMPADSRFGQLAYGLDDHDPEGHMAHPLCSAGTRAGQPHPLAPDGLLGPRFSELAHQQSVSENLSRFGAILTGSPYQQAGKKRGRTRSQRSRGPPPTLMPRPPQPQSQQQP